MWQALFEDGLGIIKLAQFVSKDRFFKRNDVLRLQCVVQRRIGAIVVTNRVVAGGRPCENRLCHLC